jgi:hypothetical protein
LHELPRVELIRAVGKHHTLWPGTTRYEFNVLPDERQLVHVFNEGIFLARCWQEKESLSRYHVPGGFFGERPYDT